MFKFFKKKVATPTLAERLENAALASKMHKSALADMMYGLEVENQELANVREEIFTEIKKLSDIAAEAGKEFNNNSVTIRNVQKVLGVEGV